MKWVYKLTEKPTPRDVTLLRPHWELGSLDTGEGIGLIFVSEEYAALAAAAPELIDVVKAYEQWEADLILCNEAWHGGLAELPTLTEALWDRLLEIQAMRNAAIAKTTPKGET